MYPPVSQGNFRLSCDIDRASGSVKLECLSLDFEKGLSGDSRDIFQSSSETIMVLILPVLAIEEFWSDKTTEEPEREW
ncbi:hypothetical protein CEXT_778781 [Caerostris extrusa]|uniref:Uncharacterized protein n=1 Tax=Caerostris extrusa TaxID=172846 RepID=A0AAV4NSY2_CAEEX|nr:hypothetical protein CEXT_778781 [Caerostris extrusa]